MTLFSKKLLDSLGILDWGYTEESSPQSFDQFKSWAESPDSNPLTYLQDHRLDLRRDIKEVYPEFQSALVFLFSYQEEKKYLIEEGHNQVAGYSLGFNGEDYHFEIPRRLKTLYDLLALENSEFKISLDIQPVLERDLAFRAGLGWFGKNSMIISREHGSYFLIGTLLLNQKLNLKTKELTPDHCGKCRQCVDDCPTNAIDVETRTIKASLCLSTFTIEMMSEVDPPAGYEKSRGEIFGCDICQDVCPWNKKIIKTKELTGSLSSASHKLLEWLSKEPQEMINELEVMSKRGVRKFFAGTVFERPGKIGWIKNLKAKLNYFQPK